MSLILALFFSLSLPFAGAAGSSCEIAVSSDCVPILKALESKADNYLMMVAIAGVRDLHCVEALPQMRKMVVDERMASPVLKELMLSIAFFAQAQDRALFERMFKEKMSRDSFASEIISELGRVLYVSYGVESYHPLIRKQGPSSMNLPNTKLIPFTKTGSQTLLFGGTTDYVLKIIPRCLRPSAAESSKSYATNWAFRTGTRTRGTSCWQMDGLTSSTLTRLNGLMRKIKPYSHAAEILRSLAESNPARSLALPFRS